MKDEKELLKEISSKLTFLAKILLEGSSLKSEIIKNGTPKILEIGQIFDLADQDLSQLFDVAPKTLSNNRSKLKSKKK